MNEIGLSTFTYVIREHWLSAFLIMVSLTTMCVVLALRWYVRRRLRQVLENRFAEEHELDLLPPPGVQEQLALDLIARMREEVWGLPEAELQLGFDAINRRAFNIVRSVGAVYYPESAQPEYEASLSDTLELVKRVSSRLARLASTIPLKYIGGRKLSDFQRYYQVYLKINENPILKLFKKNPHFYKAAKLALSA